MPTLKGRKKRDPFMSLSLEGQCETLGIPLEQLFIERSGDAWVVNGNSFKRPEPAAYNHYENLGYLGTSCEGSAPLMLMKCASLDFLAEINIFNDREDACLRYFEAQCTIHKSKIDLIIEAIHSATENTIKRHFSEIRSKPLYSTLYPEMSVDGLLSIWNSIGASGWTRIAKSFMEAPYTFRAGWPDLIIAAESDLKLVEIKTTDKLHSSQKMTISDFLLPLGLSVSVTKLIPK